MSIWKRYQPSSERPWTAQRTVHLHRRVVFGATRSEVDRDTSGTPEEAVNRVLNGECRADGVPDNFSSISDLIGNSAADSPNADRLKAWWIYRCLFSPNPLQERLTFMWHNHFATSNLKVDNLRQMKRQNEVFREQSLSPFGDLLSETLHDAAILVWLDAPANRKGHPNENLGRELMELFTLGVGHYSERDVKEAARALTGVTVRDGEFRFEERKHDSEAKTILGETKSYNLDQLSETLLSHPATSQRLAWRLTGEFFGEGIISQKAISELAQQLEQSQLDIRSTVETILHSELFFSDANINSRVSDPLSFLITPLRALEVFEHPPSTILLADWLRKLGLDLFYPPNVGGWDGGRTWLNTRTIIGRTNYIAALLNGEIHRPVRPIDLTTQPESDQSNHPDEEFAEQMALLLRGSVSNEDLKSAMTSTNDSDFRKHFLVELMAQPRAHLH